MPIVDIEVVGAIDPSLVQPLADGCGKALDSRPSGTWVRLRELAHYAENGPAQTPVFVEVLLADWPEPEVLAQWARRVCDTVANLLSRPADQVHVLFQPPGRGRVAFGGRLSR